MIGVFCLSDVLRATSTYIKSAIIFDIFPFLLKGIPDISSITDDLLY